MDSRESAFWVRLKANRWAYTLTILATLTVGILIGTVVSYGVKGKEGQKSSDATPLTVPAPQQLSNAFSQISKQLEPSVVNINTESTIKNPAPPQRRVAARARAGSGRQGWRDDSPFQDFFDNFFGGQGGPDGGGIRQRSLGSGVIVDAKGYIVTNRHVVEKADRIRVKLQDETCRRPGHEAKVIGMDQETDLAVIKIEVGSSPAGRQTRQFRRHAGGRLGARHRQSLRTAGNGHRRHRLRQGPQHRAQPPVPVLHSDRCRHQPGQFRRSAGEYGRRSHRHQHRHPDRDQFLRGRRFRHAVEHRGAGL